MKRSGKKKDGEASHRPMSKDTSLRIKVARTCSPDLSTSSLKEKDSVNYNATNGTKCVPSCFKGTTLHLKVLPGCCPTLPPLKPNEGHTVMFKVPITDSVCPPQPYPEEYCDAWDCDHVQMPCSPKNKCKNGEDAESKWELIKGSLSKGIKSSCDLEEAIRNYNRGLASQMNFNGLHVFFKEILPKEETAKFFQSTLPAMIKLALSLPEICTQPVPLLKQQMNHSTTLSQKQISCLLCHAFLCTFSRDKIPSVGSKQKTSKKFSNYPDINFCKLYAGTKNSITPRKAGKLKCLINYFTRITTKEPAGIVTFHRQCMQQLPKWSSSQKDIAHVALDSDGVIEADGLGMLQVDFADKFVGGLVLDNGCVQEEIRFVICPELIVCRLFTERLGANEVLLISGAEQYNKYRGYGDSFLWDGDYLDQTPRDSWGRRCTRIVAMDAQYFRNPADQFKVDRLERELNKAYSGFYDPEIPPENLPAVATGNWGCGVFKGNPHLKFLIQLMTVSEAGRDMMYFTFHRDKLQKELENIYCLVSKKKLKVGDVWNLLVQFDSKREELGKGKKNKFYDFVCSSLST